MSACRHRAAYAFVGCALALLPGGVSADAGDAGVTLDTAVAPAGRVATSPPTAHGASLSAGYAGSPPFVLHDAGEPDGLSVAVFKRIARELGVQLQWRGFDSVAGLLQAVHDGEVDVGVGPISITAARSELVDFAHPYFSARIGILSPTDTSTWDRLRPLFSRAFLVGVSTLLLVLLLVGVLIWQAERRKNPQQFPPAVLPGIANGMWFALVTMTTVGYGDRTPVTVAGRVLSGVWMVLAMFAASSITAGIATALTLAQIDSGSISSLDDLDGQRVAVVRGTPAEKLAGHHSARRLTFATREEALTAVESGQAQAMLYDLPVLEHHLRSHPDLLLSVHGTPIEAEQYGFAISRGSELRWRINRALLQLREDGTFSTIAEQWLNAAE